MTTLGGGSFFTLTLLVAGFACNLTHPCARKCISNQEPKQCNFHFVLHAYALDCDQCQKTNTTSQCVGSDCSRKITLAINRQSPGPKIEVCKGDKVVVDVENRLPGSFETSIHWHGQLQRGTPFYDGVAKVTQCPVTPGSWFRYSFSANESGTHFYHAHQVAQHADGLYGAFIVNDPDDSAQENELLLVGTRNSALLSGAYGALRGALVGKQRSLFSLVLNGKEKPDAMMFKPRETIFKLIHAAAYDCPIHVRVENHMIKIVRTEGSDLLPIFVKKMVVYPGERYDFELHRSGAQCKNCKMTIFGSNKCAKLNPLEINLKPTKFDEKSAFRDITDLESLSASCSGLDGANFCALDLEGFAAPEFDFVPDQTFYLQFGQYRVPKVSADDLEFRFVFNEIEYYPTFLDSSDEDGTLAPHINFVSHRPPSNPILSQPGDREFAHECESRQSLSPQMASRPRETCKLAPNFCECSHYIRVALNSTVKLVFKHQAFENLEPTAHTFHLHGHKIYVTSWSSAASVGETKVQRPLAKDTITVPPAGTVSAFFKATNPGYWLLESRAGHITSAGVGMALIVQVGDQSQMSQVPKGFPTCGGLKSDDFIF